MSGKNEDTITELNEAAVVLAKGIVAFKKAGASETLCDALAELVAREYDHAWNVQQERRSA